MNIVFCIIYNIIYQNLQIIIIMSKLRHVYVNCVFIPFLLSLVLFLLCFWPVQKTLDTFVYFLKSANEKK